MFCTLRKAVVTLALGFVCGGAADAAYLQQNLISDGSVAATVTDPNLINPWGLAALPTSPFWVADNGTGVSTIYNGNTSQILGLVVTIPAPPGSPQGTRSLPTGIVSNGAGGGFEISPGNSARFMFATEGGTIAAWNGGTVALTMVDNSAAGAVYKGLALASAGGAAFLYAANFSQARIDVFDAGFAQTALPGGFTDPNLPAGYAPFNIQALGGRLYVTYAERDANTGEEIAGAGKGLVDVFDTNGGLIERLATFGALDAPWGLALAPANFGTFSNALLVGNFGDGHISAYDVATSAFLGQLDSPGGQIISIDGLWGLSFGNGANAGPGDALFFTAGPDDESQGLFGRLVVAPFVAVPAPDTLLLALLALTCAGRRRRAVCRA